MMSLGDGRPIITGDGCLTTVPGIGHLTRKFERAEVGGIRRLLYLPLSETTFIGIRFLTIARTTITTLTITDVDIATATITTEITVAEILTRLRPPQAYLLLPPLGWQDCGNDAIGSMRCLREGW